LITSPRLDLGFLVRIRKKIFLYAAKPIRRLRGFKFIDTEQSLVTQESA
jgi:hypothetical protein